VEDVAEALIAEVAAIDANGFHYAGASIGGCVGLDLCVRHPNMVKTATIISTGARVDTPDLMRGRAVTARTEGLGPFVEAFRSRWFAPAASSATVERVLALLAGTDAESYALAAEALADFDVAALLPDIDIPILAVGGREDVSVPVGTSAALASAVPRGVFVPIDDAAHSVVAEQPAALVAAMLAFISDPPSR